MERVKKLKIKDTVSQIPIVEPVVVVPVVERRIHYKKAPGGSLRFKNRIIKPNEEFWAEPGEIPEIFLSSLIVMDESRAIVNAKDNNKVPDVKFTVKESTDGKFDVVNEYGKPINEKPLSKDEAEELQQALST